jgi:bifunctional oligoribonuclease and PAP phosphatase NrnA
MKDTIRAILRAANTIVVIQADNPDADSLGSALALEELLETHGKKVIMYCAVDMPTYIRYLDGWDRVTSELPRHFDASIIVDTSTLTLLEKLQTSGDIIRITKLPCIVLDHHATVDSSIDFTDNKLIDSTVSSTGELVFSLSKEFNWALSGHAATYIMAAILGDTQGLSNELASANTYRAMAELVEAGANRPQLEESRKLLSKMPVSIYKYKSELIAKTEFFAENTIALVHVTQNEINEHSPSYNPPAIVQFDMLQVLNVAVAVVIKTYDDGRITASVRANAGFPVAATLAKNFNGGGHDYAAGFKVTDGRSYETIKNACVSNLIQLLKSNEKQNEAL